MTKTAKDRPAARSAPQAARIRDTDAHPRRQLPPEGGTGQGRAGPGLRGCGALRVPTHRARRRASGTRRREPAEAVGSARFPRSAAGLRGGGRGRSGSAEPPRQRTPRDAARSAGAGAVRGLPSTRRPRGRAPSRLRAPVPRRRRAGEAGITPVPSSRRLPRPAGRHFVFRHFLAARKGPSGPRAPPARPARAPRHNEPPRLAGASDPPAGLGRGPTASFVPGPAASAHLCGSPRRAASRRAAPGCRAAGGGGGLGPQDSAAAAAAWHSGPPGPGLHQSQAGPGGGARARAACSPPPAARSPPASPRPPHVTARRSGPRAPSRRTRRAEAAALALPAPPSAPVRGGGSGEGARAGRAPGWGRGSRLGAGRRPPALLTPSRPAAASGTAGPGVAGRDETAAPRPGSRPGPTTPQFGGKSTTSCPRRSQQQAVQRSVCSPLRQGKASRISNSVGCYFQLRIYISEKIQKHRQTQKSVKRASQ